MLRRLSSQQGFSLQELTIAVLVAGLLASLAYQTFSEQRRKSDIRAMMSQLDTASTQIGSWANSLSDFDGNGSRLGGLTAQRAAGIIAGKDFVEDNKTANASVVKASTYTQTPPKGDNRIYVYNDVLSGGERISLTRCMTYFGNDSRICARVDMFPWGNDTSQAPTLSYRYLSCGSSEGCQSAVIYTAAQCQGWPEAPKDAPNPTSVGSACLSAMAGSPASALATLDAPSDPSSGAAQGEILPTFLLNVSVSGNGSVASTVQDQSAAILCGKLGQICSQVFQSGTNVTLIAQPAAGADFLGWTLSGGSSTCSSQPTCSVKMDQVRNVSAAFSGTNSGAETWQSLSSGYDFACAVNNDSVARCWGNNTLGQLGDGTHTQASTPTTVYGMSRGVDQISAGYQHACLRKSDSTAWCWGAGGSGRLGYGGTSSKLIPAQVMTGNQGGSVVLEGVSKVAAGGAHSCALRIDGTVYCWGNNQYGQLGNGTTTASTLASAVSGISSASAVWTGQDWSCALQGGQVKCWGRNANGQLGNGTLSSSSIPVTVSSLSAQTLSGSGYSFGHSCASGGTAVSSSVYPVYCWGSNSDSQLGNSDASDKSSPVASLFRPTGGSLSVQNPSSGGMVSAGGKHTCSLSKPGDPIYCWGANGSGQLGNGNNSTTSVTSKVKTSGGVDLAGRQVSAGGYFTCAITYPDNAMMCWGSNDHGQLGSGSSQGSSYYPSSVN